MRDPAWIAANQRRLAGEFARLRARLARAVPAAADAASAEPPPAEAAEPDGLTALMALEQAFRLSPFERDLVLLAAGVELDAALARLAAAALGDGGRPRATFGLALAALEAPHWSALAPGGPLRRWRLLEPEPGAGLADAALRLDPRVLFFLLGAAEGGDPALEGLLRPVAAPDRLTPAEAAIAAAVGGAWLAAPAGAPPPVVEIAAGASAAPGAAPRLAAAVAALAGLRLLALDAADVPDAPAERVALARLCERELALSGAALLVSAEASPPARGVARFAEEMAGPLLLAAPEPLPLAGRARLPLAPPPFGPAEREALWRLALGPERAGAMAEAVAAAATRFALGPAAVAAVAARLGPGPPPGGGAAPAGARLWAACRAEARRPLDGLAERLEPRAGWDDLVVPAETRRLLEAIRLEVRHAAAVQRRWGFAARAGGDGRALGLAALFAGPSGTGKTMAAAVLARDLDLDLYRVDLAQTVSKFIGETEKNLKRVFDAAEASGAVLLFDEADALFGKRSEVKDSHDRYANIEVGYLLQRMEAYAGLAVLTTNQRAALDPAFLRRLRFVVGFPFPDAALREALWRRAFPPEAPTAGLDPARLAQLTLPGGHIRNVALGAAFLAMEEGAPIGMGHLRRAAAAEYAKLERPLTTSELEGWP